MNTAETLKNLAALPDLLEGLVALSPAERAKLQVNISGIKTDSRLVEPGDLFIARFGQSHDARDFIGETIAAGAAAVVAEAGGAWQGVHLMAGVPVVAVDNLSAHVSLLAARFYADPSASLSVIGITGTNGKTSCSQFIAQCLQQLKFRSGLIGTLGYGTYGALKETQLTTPDPVFIQRALAEMVAEFIDPVVMEVSSVGLDQKRVAAVHFDTAVFTNLSRDHLDYHDSMESYAESKRKLFTMDGLRCAVINLDDRYALQILNAIDSQVEILTYSSSNSIASVFAEQLELTPGGYRARVHTPIGSGEVQGALLGRFNFSNILAVIATLIAYLPKKLDVPIAQLCEAVSALRPVSGRMEIVGDGHDITAVVDYAHTPEGLRSALVALGDHFVGNIWCVFGCGGNRDRGKRPMMGEVTECHAQHLILTDDNPRNESGDSIIEHILCGMDRPQDAVVIRNRAEAIEFAVANAAPGDVVLVAGKGHETYQDINGVQQLFSDTSQVRLALQRRQGNS